MAQALTAQRAGAMEGMDHPIAAWRLRGLAVLRIGFGLVWAIDAYFKWQPAFHNNLDTYLSAGADGQPAVVKAWITFWVNTVGIQPHVVGIFLAVVETALALALIFGVFSNLAYLGGIFLSLAIWSTAEGFGGPYKPGTVDIGAAIIYVLVFVALFLGAAGLCLGVDRWLTPRLGRWGWLASGMPGTAHSDGATTDAGYGGRETPAAPVGMRPERSGGMTHERS
ncbi:MAG: hypothetical protein M3Y58_12665 [Chloroflexota bacterium]|nr:hypothetical protein [Chloroflexota bacterium]